MNSKVTENRLERRLGLFPVTNIVIANMIGAGIFTTSGLLMQDLHNPMLMIFLWGFAGLIAAMKPAVRIPFIIISEACILGFFALLAWVGVDVLIILEGDNLVSLPQVPTRLTQSVIPIGAVLFLIAEVLGLPDLIREARKPDGFSNREIPSEEEAQAEAATEVPPQ